MELGVVIIEMPLGVRGYDDAVVHDGEEAVAVLDVDRTAGQMSAHVIAEGEHADPPSTVDYPLHSGWGGSCRCFFHRDITVNDLEGGARALGCQLEAPDRWHVTDALVFSIGVVAVDPFIQSRLSGLDGVERVQLEELLAHGAMEALDLACCRR